MVVSRGSVLLLLGAACYSAGPGFDPAPGQSIGGATDASASGATMWVTETDGPPSSSDASATADPDSSTGLGPGETGEGTTGSPATTCAQDEALCDAWFLPRGALQWEAVTLGGPAALAPSGAVLAAFDVEAERFAFVLTADELVRVDLESRSWVSKTGLASRLPEVDLEVRSAYSVPAYWDQETALESVTISGLDVAFIYSYDAAGDVFAFDRATAFGDSWFEPGAPDLESVREMWVDLTNADGWATGDVGQVCAGVEGPVGPYAGVITDGVQILDVGHCFAFFPTVEVQDFTPLGLPGAPSLERIGGVAYNETTGLVIFAGG